MFHFADAQTNQGKADGAGHPLGVERAAHTGRGQLRPEQVDCYFMI